MGDQEFVGQLLLPRQAKKHMELESAREVNQRAISGEILLASASSPPAREPSVYLPIRRRDSENLVEADRSEPDRVSRQVCTSPVSMTLHLTLDYQGTGLSDSTNFKAVEVGPEPRVSARAAY